MIVKLKLKSTGVFLAFTALIAMATAVSTFAQTNNSVASACDAKVKSPDYSMPEWPEKAEVKVFTIAGDFKPEQLAAILTPLSNWSAVAEASGSQVTCWEAPATPTAAASWST